MQIIVQIIVPDGCGYGNGCGICFENINTKSIDISIQLECSHWFHSKCVKSWCKRCIESYTQPNCPFCEQTISNEY